MNDLDPEDQTVWVLITARGHVAITTDEDEARDRMRRIDRLYTARLCDWEEHP